jgi:hypothetical protein
MENSRFLIKNIFYLKSHITTYNAILAFLLQVRAKNLNF